MSDEDAWATANFDSLLEGWFEQINNRSIAHKRLALRFERKHYQWGLPPVIINTLAGSSGWAVFRNCENAEDSSVSCTSVEAIRLFIGGLTLIGAMLTAYVTFMKYMSASERHKTAADNFSSLGRSITEIIKFPTHLRGNPIDVISKIRERFDSLVRDSPQVDDFDVEEYVKAHKSNRVNAGDSADHQSRRTRYEDEYSHPRSYIEQSHPRHDDDHRVDFSPHAQTRSVSRRLDNIICEPNSIGSLVSPNMAYELGRFERNYTEMKQHSGGSGINHHSGESDPEMIPTNTPSESTL